MIALAIPLALIGLHLVLFRGGESYCWWNPSIDTQFTSQYSEKVFDSITPGMTQSNVVALLGEPLFKQPIPQGHYTFLNAETTEEWRFTDDGKCSWADWAWLGRYVYFNGTGAVTETTKVIHYD